MLDKQKKANIKLLNLLQEQMPSNNENNSLQINRQQKLKTPNTRNRQNYQMLNSKKEMCETIQKSKVKLTNLTL